MIGADTNVVLRLILDDDPVQSPAVTRILDSAGTGGIFVSLIVVVEVAWVLKRGYHERPETILDMVEDLLATREFTVERPDLVQAALEDARKAKCGVADAIIARLNEDRGAGMTLTFDIKAKRLPTMIDAMAYP